MYFRGSNDILVILSVGIQWEDLWNSYLKKSFEIHGFESLKSWMDLPQIQILIVLSHPNKEFGFELWAQIHPSKLTTKDWNNNMKVKSMNWKEISALRQMCIWPEKKGNHREGVIWKFQWNGGEICKSGWTSVACGMCQLVIIKVNEREALTYKVPVTSYSAPERAPHVTTTGPSHPLKVKTNNGNPNLKTFRDKKK